jgi:protein-S-isoprenylcysteine O-methyltransferase Ste14
MPPTRFKTPALYKVVRHPICPGFIIAYILVGIALEERDAIELFGDEYRNCRKRVSMLDPMAQVASRTQCNPAARSV